MKRQFPDMTSTYIHTDTQTHTLPYTKKEERRAQRERRGIHKERGEAYTREREERQKERSDV